MPKLTLTFDLPEEREDAELAQSASKLYCMLLDVAQYRRTLNKHENRKSIPVNEIVEKLSELLSEFEY